MATFLPIPNPQPIVDGFNQVIFVTGDDRFFLEMDRGFMFAPGIEPAILSAKIDYKQHEKMVGLKADGNLVAAAIGRIGRVEFWCSSSAPGAAASAGPKGTGLPDLVFENMQVVEVESELVAHEVEGFAGDNPRLRTVIYRLHLADRRRDFKLPRGGVLEGGTYNKSPILGVVDANKRGTITAKKAIELCLAAMGLSEVTVPHIVSDFPPPIDLEWRGNHAPTELANLLAENNCLLILNPDATFTLTRIGEGDAPVIIADRKITAMPKSWGGLDRRSKAVLFCSHPNPALDTITVTGPGEDIELVKPSGGAWAVIDAAGITAAAANIRAGFLNGKDGNELERRFLFRAIRLATAKYGPGPVLREVRLPGSIVDEIGVTGPTAMTDASGFLWKTASSVRMTVEQLLDRGQVMILSEPLGKIQPPEGQTWVFSPDKYFKEVEAGEISLQVTREVWDKDTAGNWTPTFTYTGVIQDAASSGGLRIMSDAEVAAYKAQTSKDFPIVARPELVELRVDGVVGNYTELRTRAIALARQWIGPSEGDVDHLEGRGWFGITMNGKVAQVTITQTPPMITYKLNNFFQPMARHLQQAREKQEKKEAGQSFPNQSQTGATRAASGASGAQAAAAPVMPMPAERQRPLFGMAMLATLEMVSGENGTKTTKPTWKYKAMVGGQQIGTDLSPLFGRSKLAYEGPATQGVVCASETGGVTLIVAGEEFLTTPCAEGT